MFSAQSDSIYPKGEAPFAVNVIEITEKNISFTKNSALTYTIELSQVSKIKYKNGSIEKFDKQKIEQTKTNPDQELNSSGKAENLELNTKSRSKIEKIAAVKGREIAQCAFNELDKIEPFVTWDKTHRSSTVPTIVYIGLRCFYEKAELSDRYYFDALLEYDEVSKNCKWELITSENRNDRRKLADCQKVNKNAQ